MIKISVNYYSFKIRSISSFIICKNSKNEQTQVIKKAKKKKKKKKEEKFGLLKNDIQCFFFSFTPTQTITLKPNKVVILSRDERGFISSSNINVS